ncbi:alkaline phosphatase family protein [Mycobacterium sp. DL592]|uniref:alkaline phosphatase family protein n=1 Tax=Mycobacterium sp. DL592 TaxID=2675524 RepID=UPI001FB8E831|nr:alkaline phosphatase family protein [Mycobacterium sp. DL592]
MTTIKQVCLGAAIAGVVAGTGSAMGTAVAYAEGPASDSPGTSQSDSPGASASSSHAGPAGRSARSAATTTRGGSTTGDDAKQPATAAAARVPGAGAAQRRTTALLRDIGTTQDQAPETVAAVDVVPALVRAPAPAAPAPTPAAPVTLANVVAFSASATSGRVRSASATTTLLSAQPTHVLLIGTDGTNLGKILADPVANSGFIDLMNQSVTGATSIVGHTTISGPSWTTILTGVWDNKSGVINNLFNPAPYDSWPTVFNLIEYNNPAIDTAVIADWKYINDIGNAGGYKADVNQFVAFTNSWADTDAQVVSNTIQMIQNTQAGDSNFIFSYQVQVDEAGHAYGGGSPQYAQAVTNVSNNIADIMAAIDTWETANPGEKWTVIVTTDHGHQQSQGFGHGFQSPNETSSFVIFDLAGDNANDGKQNLGYTNADITPTIINLFGLPARSDFDGVPLTTKTTSIVDPTDLVQALKDATAMYGYPNIGVDLALGVRTVFASIPYFLDGFVTSVATQLQGIVDQNIFLLSALAGIAEALVNITGDIVVGTTQALARVVAHLTGSGVIAPTDPPLPPPAGAAVVPTPAPVLLAVNVA